VRQSAAMQARVLEACVVAGALSLWSSVAGAHALLTSPTPRDNSDLHKDPNGPCGVSRAASQPMNAPLEPGSELNLTWTETVNHPGCFVIDFSMAGDTGWQTLAMVPHESDGNTPRPYATTVTLPAAACADCTLRLRQIMLGAEPAAGACPPANPAPGATYYSCANMVLAGDSASGGSASGGSASGGSASGGSASGGSAGGASGSKSSALEESSCAYAAKTGSSGSGWLAVCAALVLALRRGKGLPAK
jgi:hypothetical protein